MRPKPTTQNTVPDRQTSARFLIATLMLFFERTNPVSRQQNPAYMTKTRAVQIRTQTKSSDSASGKPAFPISPHLSSVCSCGTLGDNRFLGQWEASYGVAPSV